MSIANSDQTYYNEKKIIKLAYLKSFYYINYGVYKCNFLEKMFIFKNLIDRI